MDCKMIIGANYGDEGKGMMTDYFAAKAKGKVLGVLVNGGPQRGHTVVTPSGARHVWHHFSAGTAAGAISYCSEFFCINPLEYWREVQELEFAPDLIIDPLCRITTPWDMMINQIKVSQKSEGYSAHSSCGYGIWETIKRYDFHQGPVGRSRVADLYLPTGELDKEAIEDFATVARNYYRNSVGTAWIDIYWSETLFNNFCQDLYSMLSTCTVAPFKEAASAYDTVLFEMGQGLLLDEERDMEYGTPSCTGVDDVLTILNGVECSALEVCFVSRSYLTRHGDGPIEGYILGEITEKTIRNLDKTNQPNPHQGTMKLREARPHDLFKYVDDEFDKVQRWAHWKKLDVRKSKAVTWMNIFKNHGLMGADYISYGLTRDDVKAKQLTLCFMSCDFRKTFGGGVVVVFLVA